VLFPAALFVYYMICWVRVGRDPRVENVTPQYDPPAGISPGVARYILTGGSDGTTLAAVLAALAAKRVISIHPQNGSFLIRSLNHQALNVQTMLSPEEAVLARRLLNVDMGVPQTDAMTNAITSSSPVASAVGTGQAMAAVTALMFDTEKPGEVVLDPQEPIGVKFAIEAIQEAFRKNFDGRFFRWNFRFAALGIAATFLWGLGTAAVLDSHGTPAVFLTFWLLLFTTLSSVVISGVATSRPNHPTMGQRLQHILLPLLFFVLPGSLIYFLGLTSAPFLVLALLMSVALNSIFFVVMRAPTPEGLKILEQLTGFREFLERVEQDPLDRLNHPMSRAELMDRYLAYAIALNVKEGWGDTMAAAFSNAVVAR
jgi:hypothetical protein